MKNVAGRIWLSLFLLTVGLHLASLVWAGGLWAQVTKALLMPLLGIYAFSKQSHVSARVKGTLLLALGFSWLGDVLLLFTESHFFIMGLGAFLLAHIVYIFSYGYASATYPLKKVWQRWWYYLPILGYGCSFSSYLLPQVPPEMLVPVAAYALVIVTMLLAAAGRGKYTHPTSFILVTLGAVLFVISDSFIAVNKFVDPLPNASLLIMTTYILGQWAITEGLLRHPSPVRP